MNCLSRISFLYESWMTNRSLFVSRLVDLAGSWGWGVPLNRMAIDLFMWAPKKYSMTQVTCGLSSAHRSDNDAATRRRVLWTEYVAVQYTQVTKTDTRTRWLKDVFIQVNPWHSCDANRVIERNSKLCWMSLIYLSETPGFRGSLPPLRSGKIEHLEINLFVYAAASVPPKCRPFV